MAYKPWYDIEHIQLNWCKLGLGLRLSKFSTIWLLQLLYERKVLSRSVGLTQHTFFSICWVCWWCKGKSNFAGGGLMFVHKRFGEYTELWCNTWTYSGLYRIFSHHKTKNAAVQVALPTSSPNVADAAEQADLPGQVDVIDELCYDNDYQQYQAARAYPTYSPSPCLDIPQLDGSLDAVTYHHREEEKKRAKERAEDLQKITSMLNNIF